MKSLLIASSNPGKLREFQSILQDLGVNLVLPADIGVSLQVEEDGADYYQNALKKAVTYCQASGLITLADDSGLEVDALGGAPGLHSARYSPKPGANDGDRRTYLLSQLAQHPQPWPAHFHCSLVLALPDGDHYTFDGDCPGEIVSEERGEHGFGYDPIFRMAGRDKTMAQLPEEEKNRISHRGRATLAALPTLKKLLEKEMK
ncbi:MAG: RdgB/HAM1 family non-canonical purine NTP pyrophosphatase [Anaerolineaceae bacterium]|nr:RdgB/HAM1 family non-canonical purine NTP pyrophosphatase [Anaerolineaceae bacterium]